VANESLDPLTSAAYEMHELDKGKEIKKKNNNNKNKKKKKNNNKNIICIIYHQLAQSSAKFKFITTDYQKTNENKTQKRKKPKKRSEKNQKGTKDKTYTKLRAL